MAVDFAEVMLKDQFISRSDMWRLKTHLKETCAYVGKGITYSCMRASIRELLASEQPVHSGYITENTKIIFRSRSAEYIMLFQMSREMWDFAPDGQLYFEKAVNKFLPALFTKWRQLGANHCLSMVMFSRTYYDHAELFDLEDTDPSAPINKLDPPMDRCRMDLQQRDNLLRDHEGRYYHDFYTVVCIEERTNWERVVLQLKTKFEEYPYMVNWRFSYGSNPDKYHSKVLGVNAIAEYSGFLEAINLAQNMLDSRHFTDRDLTRTGQSVVVISAGTGIFIVNPSLEQQTKQRMIDKGIGCDLVCVTKPPLHVVPLFIMKKPYVLKPSPTPQSQAPQLASMTPTSPYSLQHFSTPTFAPNGFGPSATANPAAKARSFPSHKIAHWVYLFFHDLHVQHDHGAATRNFTTTSTMPDFLQQNNDCGGIVLPLKMAPSVVPSSALGIAASASGSSIKGDSLLSARSDSSLSSSTADTPQSRSKSLSSTGEPAGNATGTSDILSEKDRLGMMHDMDLEVPTVSAETSRVDKLKAMMDAYDEGLFSAPAPVVPPTAPTSLSGSNERTPRNSVPNTPVGHLPHAYSTSQLNSSHHTSHSPLVSSTSTGLPNRSNSTRLTPSSLGRAPVGVSKLRMPGIAPASPSKETSASLNTSTATSSAQMTGSSVGGTSLTNGGLVTPGSSLSTSFTQPESMPGPGQIKTPLREPVSRSISQNLHPHSHNPTTTPNSINMSSSSVGGILGRGSSTPSQPPSKASSVDSVGGGMLELNPFSLELKPAPPASNRRRWEHLWARHSIQFDFLESDPSGPHWKSLTQPASLPLTTSYFPSPKELKDNFQFYSHSVDPDDFVHPMSLEEHLTEHIAQRLVQGAQIMLPDGASISQNSAFLSAGNSFHQLSIKKPNIIVNFYGAKNKVLDHERIRYRYFLWTEHTARRLSKEIDLHYKSSIFYPWNTLDQLLSGYELEFMDNYNFWNVNMMLVPIDAKMSASAAIAGFNKFKEVLTQRMVKLSDPNFGPMKVNVHVSPAAQAAEEASKRADELKKSAALGSGIERPASTSVVGHSNSSISKDGLGSSTTGKFSRDSSNGTLASSSFSSLPELIDSHNTQIILSAIKDSNLVNEKHFKAERTGEQVSFVFVASKVVDWITAHVNVRTRPEAIAICEDFTANGVFRPVSLPLNSGFRDGANYYTIVDTASLGNSTASMSANGTHPGHESANATVGGSLKFSNTSTGSNALIAPVPANAPGSAPLDRRAITPGPYLASSTSTAILSSASHSAVPHKLHGHEDIRISQDLHGEQDLRHHDELGRRNSLSHHHSASTGGTVSGYIQPGSQPTEGSILDSESHATTTLRAVEEYRHPVSNLAHQNSEPGVIRLAMDSSKTDRYEWVNVVYDTIFDPSVAYEFQFQWLCCTGCVLSDLITQLTRKAKSFGFSLIQIPVKHDIVHSFLSPRKDSFAWSELSVPHQMAVCHVLVRVLDFLPRKRPNQFIHRSGVIIIDISNNIFQWTVNWTDVNAYTTAQNYQLLKRFRDFMTQVTLLKQQSATPGGAELSYGEFVNGLVQKIAPFSVQSFYSPSSSESSVDV